MDTEIKAGKKVYSLRMQKIVIVIAVDGNYAIVQDKQGNRISTSITQLETMEEHVENKLRLD